MTRARPRLSSNVREVFGLPLTYPALFAVRQSQIEKSYAIARTTNLERAKWLR